MVDTKKDIVDMYYNHIEKEFNCKISDQLLGKRYVIGQEFVIGNFSRMKIEEGLEISKFKVNKTDLYFDNRKHKEDILELGYCYSGHSKILCLPQNKEYILKAGDRFIYKIPNDVEKFKFTYDNCKTISIHMNLNTIRNVINPIWENKIIEDWHNNINNIFKGDILIIEKASYQIKKIAEQIDSISIDNIIGYMKLKLKTIELLETLFQENANEKILNNQKSQEKEIVTKGQDIINRNVDKQLSVKSIATRLNISLYKLQEAFKNITGATVYEYIKKVKIERAKYLLENTDMSVLEIVNEIGYENPSKFSSLFKKYNGITPLKYRKLNMSE